MTSRLHHYYLLPLTIAFITILSIDSNASTARHVEQRDATSEYLDTSDGADWPGYGRTFSEQHYSPLAEINRGNVKTLGLSWWMDLSLENSVSQPIAVNGILYFTTGYSVVHAVEAKSGRELWSYDPEVAEQTGFNLRYGWGSRGIAWWKDKIYTGTQDGRLIAIDTKSGKAIWSVQTIDEHSARMLNGINSAEMITGAPRAFDGKVIVGFGGDGYKNRGYVTAYDAQTGKKVWRFYTVPGNPSAGFENDAMRVAAATWSGSWWENGGGGTVWNAISYDKDTNTVFLGVGNGYPWNRRARSEDKGDNLFLCSIVALDATTGTYRWHYQVIPGDTWDYEPTTDMELGELTIAGRSLKVLMQASKDGFFYVIDRITGKLVSAKPFAKVTWATGIDLKTGRPVEAPGARYPNGSSVELWPSTFGAHSWLPMAFNPKLNLAYIPAIEMGDHLDDSGIDTKNWRPPELPALDVALHGSSTDGTGALVAWDPITQRSVWRVPQYSFINGGVMATGGELVFQGSLEGNFNAYDAKTGEVLWSFAAQAPVIAPPISYSVNGTQYITVLTGTGTGVGVKAASVRNIERYGIDPRSQARRVLTFILNGTAKLPRSTTLGAPTIDDPNFAANAESAAAGERVYNEHYCATCHGEALVASAQAPDLRRSDVPLSADAFAKVVRGGALTPHGMPTFGELTDRELQDLRQYIRTEAQILREGHPLSTASK